MFAPHAEQRVYRLRPAMLALLSGMSASALVAQEVPTAALAPLVAAGDSVVRSELLRPMTSRYTLVAYRNGQQVNLGIITDVLSRDVRNDVPVIRRALTVQRGEAQLIDSTVTDARTLAPKSHRAVQPSRLIALEFSGKRVKGSLGPTDLPSLPIDTTLAVIPFDSSNWDLLVRALPLEKGYRARFRVYDTDSGLHEYQIEVTGSTTILEEEAHVVIFTLAKGRESVVWIAKATRQLLQIETMVDASTMLRQVLQR